MIAQCMCMHEPGTGSESESPVWIPLQQKACMDFISSLLIESVSVNRYARPPGTSGTALFLG